MMSRQLKPDVYGRYVDDGFGIWRQGREKFEEFKKEVNNQHENIKWKFEEMKEGKITFLDCEIYLDSGMLKTRVYRKPTHSGAYINYMSNHGFSTKAGVIRNLVRRGKKYCDTE